jgi:hypothetical protein
MPDERTGDEVAAAGAGTYASTDTTSQQAAAGTSAEGAGKTTTDASGTTGKKAEGKTLSAEDLLKENESLKTKIGGFGRDAGNYRKIMQAVQSDPAAFIKALAKENKLNVKFEDSAFDHDALTKAVNDGTATKDQLTQFRQSMKDEVIKEIFGEFKPVLSTMMEERLAGRYKDFDDLAQDREELSMAVASRQITSDEVYHLAARGRRIDAALKDAEKSGYDRAMKEVGGKLKGGIEDGSGHVDEKKFKAENQKVLDGALVAMRTGSRYSTVSP